VEKIESVAGPEFARLNTGGVLHAETAGMACFSPAKTEQLESKRAETVKAFAAGAKAFPNSPWCLTPKAALPRSFTVCSQHLRRRLAHFDLRAHFLGLGRLLVETRSKLRNRCAEVRCCSWSQREGKLLRSKNRMCCKRVVDHKIPALASSLAPRLSGAAPAAVVPPQVKPPYIQAPS